MLKKLVKYGNSTALVLDKAILELLDIEEGATIKIKTDGRSIIITPHIQSNPEKISTDYTHMQAHQEVAVKKCLEKYNITDAAQYKELKKDLSDILSRQAKALHALQMNKEYTSQILALPAKNLPQAELIAQFKAVRNAYAPELESIEQELAGFEKKHNLPDTQSTFTPAERNQMHQKFLELFTENHDTLTASGSLLNNSDFQHELQLLAEKFNTDKNVDAYLTAADTLFNKHVPGNAQMIQKAKKITQEYSTKKKS